MIWLQRRPRPIPLVVGVICAVSLVVWGSGIALATDSVTDGDEGRELGAAPDAITTSTGLRAIRVDPSTSTQVGPPASISSCTNITQSGSYVLDQDVTNDSTDTCIEITADDVTFDGNGHTVDGDFVADGDDAIVLGPLTSGIEVSGENVTVRNVTVSEWTRGITFRDDEGRIESVDAGGNGLGVRLDGSNGTVVTDVTASGSDDGLALVDSWDGSFSGVDATNLNSGGVGLSLSSSGNNTFTGLDAGGPDQGIHLDPGSHDNEFTDVTVSNGGTGIWVGASTDNTFRTGSITGYSNRGVSLLQGSDGTAFVNLSITGGGVDVYGRESRFAGTNVTFDSGAFSFTAEAVSLDATATPPASPADYAAAGGHVTVAALTGTSSLNLSTTYGEVAVGNHDEGTLRFWRHDGSWSEVTASSVDVDANVVDGSATSFGVFAPLVTNDTTSPTAEAGTNVTVDEDVAVQFDAGNSTDDFGIASYDWRFGDGTNATGQIPEHAYSTPGTYTVTLAVTDVAGNVAVDSITVTVSDVTTPEADAGANVTIDDDVPVDFDGTGSTDNVAVTSHRWEFGDGANATGPTPMHTYADPGTYTVTLTVTDAAANADGDALVVTVVDATAPTADAGPNRTVDEDATVGFDGTNSTDNVGVAGHAWDFGDGNSTSGGTVTHVYSDPGTYAVTLTANDSAGNDDVDTLTVTVRDVTPPVADAGANVTTGEGVQVTFDGSNSTDNGAVSNYSWDFGDGSNATGASPVHTYVTPGTYTVRLNVTDSAGNRATDTLVARVGADSNPGGGGSDGGGSNGGGSSGAGGLRLVSLEASDTAFEVGESVNVRAVIANERSEDRTLEVDLRRDGASVETWSVTVGADRTQTESLAHRFATPGRYELVIDGEVVESLTVVETSTTEVPSTATLPNETPTDASGSSPTQTSGAPRTSTEAARSTEVATGQPGFGVGIAILALIVIVGSRRYG